MELYLVLITIIGIAALGMAWMPAFTDKTKISYSILYVAAGALLYLLIDDLPFPDPLTEQEYTLRLTEMVVIISLMGTGLKIDQPFSFKKWAIPFRLVTITMVLSILAVAILAHYLLHLNLASSVLLGAVLAPTDPVLASDVQVGPPLEETHDNVRFSLTAEAGMNDGMAFPFTWLAIFLAGTTTFTEFVAEWTFYYLLYKIAIGVICGFIIGKGIAYLIFGLSERKKTYKLNDGLVSVCATLLTYGITELVSGYGFIAVFVAAITIRNYELGHRYHKKLHSFTDQIERILLAIVLILFGGGLLYGLVANLSWLIVVFALATVFLIRPICSWIALLTNKFHRKEKLAISFYGIKGIGSFFYLAFAIREADFGREGELWTIVSSVVLLSILIHGMTATTVIQKLSEQFSEKKN